MVAMSPNQNRHLRRAAIALLVTFHTALASAAYDATFCAQVAGTMNIHWRATGGPFAPCTGVETTNGTLAQAATGSIVMSGTAVSNPACIGTSAYTLALSPDTSQLNGFDTIFAVPMNLVRTTGQDCFVGTWTFGADVYEAHIWALAFPLLGLGIPTMSEVMLVLLALLLGIAGAFRLRQQR